MGKAKRLKLIFRTQIDAPQAVGIVFFERMAVLMLNFTKVLTVFERNVYANLNKICIL